MRVANSKWLPTFKSRKIILALYVAIGASMSLFCLKFPGLGLSSFLIISALHFTEGELPSAGPLMAVAFGVSSILCPIGFHPHVTSAYLGFFIDATNFMAMVPYIQTGAYLAFSLCLLLIALAYLRGTSSGDLIQRLICVFAWLLLPPLSGFSVWFLGRHSRMHLMQCR